MKEYLRREGYRINAFFLFSYGNRCGAHGRTPLLLKQRAFAVNLADYRVGADYTNETDYVLEQPCRGTHADITRVDKDAVDVCVNYLSDGEKRARVLRHVEEQAEIGVKHAPDVKYKKDDNHTPDVGNRYAPYLPPFVRAVYGGGFVLLLVNACDGGKV
jgi:hypothetical protein